MTRFLLLFALFFSVALLAIFHAEKFFMPVFQEIFSIFIALAMIVGPLSYALYTYVEGIIKDVAADKDKRKHGGYHFAIDSLSALKREVLVNAFAVFGLLVFERVCYGVSVLFFSVDELSFNWVRAFMMSLRIACLVMSVYIVVVQFFGFFVANEYRAIISR